MRRFLPALALTAAILAAPAQADTFDVVGARRLRRRVLGDRRAALAVPVAARRGPTAGGTRAATHGVILHAGWPYVLSAGELSVTSGSDPRRRGRAVDDDPGRHRRRACCRWAARRRSRWRTSRCRAAAPPSATGGNLLTDAGTTLSLVNVRVTGGTANAGARHRQLGLAADPQQPDRQQHGGERGRRHPQRRRGRAPRPTLSVLELDDRVQPRAATGPAPESRPRATRPTPSRSAFATVARNFGNGLSGGVAPPPGG